MTRSSWFTGTRAGPGGLGIHAATVIAGSATAAPSLPSDLGRHSTGHETPIPTAVNWIRSPPVRWSWLATEFSAASGPGDSSFNTTEPSVDGRPLNSTVFAPAVCTPSLRSV